MLKLLNEEYDFMPTKKIQTRLIFAWNLTLVQKNGRSIQKV